MNEIIFELLKENPDLSVTVEYPSGTLVFRVYSQQWDSEYVANTQTEVIKIIQAILLLQRTEQ